MFTPVPYPPVSTLHPVLALETFLQSLETVHCPAKSNTTLANDANNRNDADTHTEEVSNNNNLARKKNILRMADCLFGSMLEGALSTLDSYVITEIESLNTKRRMFVLANPNTKRSSTRQDEPQTYFCILPQAAPARSENWTQNNNNKASNSSHGTQFHFCSCRSYFERTKSCVGCGSVPTKSAKPQCHALCKHLLALKLRPFLLESWRKIETVTEDQFSQEVLKKLLRESGY